MLTVSSNQIETTQKELPFDTGEFFKFRIHYGMVTAGYATLEVKEAVRNNKKVFYGVGNGYTKGITEVFFQSRRQLPKFF